MSQVRLTSNVRYAITFIMLTVKCTLISFDACTWCVHPKKRPRHVVVTIFRCSVSQQKPGANVGGVCDPIYSLNDMGVGGRGATDIIVTTDDATEPHLPRPLYNVIGDVLEVVVAINENKIKGAVFEIFDCFHAKLLEDFGAVRCETHFCGFVKLI